MRTHLDRKTKCPGYVDYEIVLTDSVKQHILENRVYRPKIEQEVVLKHITIQNNHITQINNYFDEDD
jgi:hypothetical protein